MATERTRLQRGSPNLTPHLWINKLGITVNQLQKKAIKQEGLLQTMQATIDDQANTIKGLKELVDWSDDPAVRRARRSNLVLTAGSLGWWSGALGTSETLKASAALLITGNEQLAAFGLFAWIAGCAISAGQGERLARNLAVRMTRDRYRNEPTVI